MIFSSLNSTNDFSLCPSAIRRAVEYLKTTDFFHMEPGDYPIEGNLMYVKVFDQTSIPFEDTRPEIHHHYADVQYWPEGEDLAGITPNPGTYTVVEAHESDDLYFLEGIQNESFIHCLPGCIAVYFPWDVHRPSVAYEGKPITYRKVVVKVHMDLMKNSI
jgi:biofilm protein TabA